MIKCLQIISHRKPRLFQCSPEDPKTRQDPPENEPIHWDPFPHAMPQSPPKADKILWWRGEHNRILLIWGVDKDKGCKEVKKESLLHYWGCSEER